MTQTLADHTPTRANRQAYAQCGGTPSRYGASWALLAVGFSYEPRGHACPHKRKASNRRRARRNVDTTLAQRGLAHFARRVRGPTGVAHAFHGGLRGISHGRVGADGIVAAGFAAAAACRHGAAHGRGAVDERRLSRATEQLVVQLLK
eukprot:680368-Pleurochrysis_carterae.AAC.1